MSDVNFGPRCAGCGAAEGERHALVCDAHVVFVPYTESRSQEAIDAQTMVGYERCMRLLNTAVENLLAARLAILHDCTGDGWRDFVDEIDGFVRPIALRIEVQRGAAAAKAAAAMKGTP